MAHTSTLTLLGQSQANGSATKTNGSLKMSKAQLDMPIDESDGLRVRDSAKVCNGKDKQQVITDENNNVSRVVGHSQEEPKKEEKVYRMWGFFRVDQPVKTLNSIAIPIAHILCFFALLNITWDTKWVTIFWGESYNVEKTVNLHCHHDKNVSWKRRSYPAVDSSFT